MSIAIEDVSKHFGAFAALDRVRLHVASGELLALLGPSGSGKTTLLRILAGLERPDADGGRVRMHGTDVTGATPAERRVGLVFQHYALFEHLTVAGNVAFGLRMRRGRARVPRREIDARVQRLLDLVQLSPLADRYPSQLSGGQRQRVGLARALAIEPRVLLLDEPFGALDAQVRRDLRRWLKELHAELGITSVFVTHDQEEALELATRVVVMHQGRVQQVGTPAEVYEQPANAFVYEFLGSSNVIDGRASDRVLHIDGARYPLDVAASGDVRTFVRPHDLEIVPEANGGSTFPVRVRDVQLVGPTARVLVEREVGGGVIEAHLTRAELAGLSLREGLRVHARARSFKVYAGGIQP
ncbi:sulfate/molybdate ABC transporter ATP-binding protein [Candidatus Binatia bacterium]|nr:sulfate/molybdate ABC transporter ATP-binding protein [Candidatus Binatia bacterium]